MEEDLKCHCHDDGDCNCGDDCHCGCSHDVIPIEEKIVLIGKKDDEKTLEAQRLLDKQKVDYLFVDIDKKSPILNRIDLDGMELPSILLLHTVVSAFVPGLDLIKDVFKNK